MQVNILTNKIVKDEYIDLFVKSFEKEGINVIIKKDAIISKSPEVSPEIIFEIEDIDNKRLDIEQVELWNCFQKVVNKNIKEIKDSINLTINIPIVDGKGITFLLPDNNKLIEIALKSIPQKLIETKTPTQFCFDSPSLSWIVDTFEEREKLKMMQKEKLTKIIQDLKESPLVVPIDKIILAEEIEDA